jgi:hypothetical protein
MHLLSSILALITVAAVGATPFQQRSVNLDSSNVLTSNVNFTDITTHIRATQAGIDSDSINRLKSINIIAPGVNSFGNNGRIWIGGGGFCESQYIRDVRFVQSLTCL